MVYRNPVASSPDMSKAHFTIAYDGPALRGGTMDVRDLAPALLAVGQLIDAANHALNGEASKIAVSVHATQPACFSIGLEIAQSWGPYLIGILKGDEATAAANLLALLGGGSTGLFYVVKTLRGQKPDKVERLDTETVRLTHGKTTMDVPLKTIRLYQDLAVREAAERVIYEPLLKDGIDAFTAFKGSAEEFSITEDDAFMFKKPDSEERILLDNVRRSAFSIISLAFKDDNKWRLHDGNSQISAVITDEDFLRRVNSSEISFAKGDVLICDVRVRQTQSESGLKTEYTVEKVLEHKSAPRQLALMIEEPDPPIAPQKGRYEGWE